MFVYASQTTENEGLFSLKMTMGNYMGKCMIIVNFLDAVVTIYALTASNNDIKQGLKERPAGHQCDWKFSVDQNFKASHQHASNLLCLFNVLNWRSRNWCCLKWISYLISGRNLTLVLSKFLICIETEIQIKMKVRKSQKHWLFMGNKITKGGRLVWTIFFQSDLVQATWQLVSRVSAWKDTVLL